MHIVNAHNQSIVLNTGHSYVDKKTGFEMKATKMKGQFMVRQAGGSICDDGWLVCAAGGGLAFPVDAETFSKKYTRKKIEGEI